MSVIVKAKAKELAKGMNVSSDVYEKLEQLITDIVAKGCERAKGNNRSTLMAKDL